MATNGSKKEGASAPSSTFEDLNLAESNVRQMVATANTDQFFDDDEAPLDKWDGKSTKLRLLFPILRGTKTEHRFLGRGQTFEVQASQDTDNPAVWHGPEGEHVMELIRTGVIADTREGQARLNRHAAVDSQRGVTTENLAELSQPVSAREMRQRLSSAGLRDLEGNVTELRRREGVESGNTAKELLEAILGSREPAYAGAAAAGSAANRDGTPMLPKE